MKLPYFRWFPADFETDENVKLMNIYEIGLFTICLNHAWVNDGLPVNPDKIAKLLKVPTAQFMKAWPRVVPCFHEVDGRLRNPRQEIERLHSETKVAQAKLAVAARKLTGNRYTKILERTFKDSRTDVLDGLERTKTYVLSGSVVSSSSEESAERNQRPLGSAIAGLTPPDWVERWYGRHPKARNLPMVQYAVVELAKLPNAEELFPEIDTVHAAWCASEQWTEKGGRFSPKLDEWLTDRGWTKPPPKFHEVDRAAAARRAFLTGEVDD